MRLETTELSYYKLPILDFCGPVEKNVIGLHNFAIKWKHIIKKKKYVMVVKAKTIYV